MMGGDGELKWRCNGMRAIAHEKHLTKRAVFGILKVGRR